MITVVDYGRGNLHSLGHALAHVGADYTIGDAPDALGEADAIVLPGVGAFGDAMAALSARGLVAPLRAAAAAGVPMLGICLGMQLFATRGTEFGDHAGLDLIPGTVTRLPDHAPDSDGATRIPNVGWRRLTATAAEPLLDGATAEAMMYFVHSFGFAPDDPAAVTATTRVNGRDVAAIVRRGAVVGCQFHPEKSGPAGLAMLGHFVSAARAARPQLRSVS